MRILFRHLHHSPSASLTDLIERKIGILGRSLRIDEAHVTVERRIEASPAFRFSAHLVTPGPDIFAEAMEHTLRAAVHKTVAELENRIASRHMKRARRSRDVNRGRAGRTVPSATR